MQQLLTHAQQRLVGQVNRESNLDAGELMALPPEIEHYQQLLERLK
ncbi:MAG TPA: hypothetical protein V6D48_23075 [Oculatellaceae cyanobacterium]